MKWLVIVIFAGISPSGGKDLYVFTNPTFDTQTQCQADISDPNVVPILVKKVIQDNGPKKIEKVVCMLDKDFKELLEGLKKKEKGVAL
jgi:hypothetical protein|tara:strand:- start:880 stop:1143 length:264 start_codon:yes stop_codon:yes gene_type:complete